MLALRSGVVFGYLNTSERKSKHVSSFKSISKNSTEPLITIFTDHYFIVNKNVNNATRNVFLPEFSILPALLSNCIISVTSFPKGEDSDQTWEPSLGKDDPGPPTSFQDFARDDYPYVWTCFPDQVKKKISLTRCLPISANLDGPFVFILRTVRLGLCKQGIFSHIFSLAKTGNIHLY